MPRPSGSWEDHEEKGYPVLEPGWYLCDLIDIIEKKTRNGDEMWTLKFEVHEGPREGTLIFDNLAFVGAGWNKAKLLAHRLGGVELKGNEEITQEMILRKKCWCKVETRVYQGKKQNSIPFDGFEPADTFKPPESQSAGEAIGGDDVPF
jgi:hypothetical protein